MLSHHDNILSNIFTRPICLVKYKLWIDPTDWEDVLYIGGRGRNSYLLARVILRQADGSIPIGIP
jgi:hypothetical protein